VRRDTKRTDKHTLTLSTVTRRGWSNSMTSWEVLLYPVYAHLGWFLGWQVFRRICSGCWSKTNINCRELSKFRDQRSNCCNQNHFYRIK